MSATKQKTSSRVVKVLSAIYFEPSKDALGAETTKVRTATRGQEINLTAEEEARLDAAGALLPAGSSSRDAQARADALIDAYRAERGDPEALQRHVARAAAARTGGDIVNVDSIDVDGATVGELSAWIKESKPNVDDTVALAEGDPDRAQKVLDAETTATGGSPRAGVQSKLEKLIEG